MQTAELSRKSSFLLLIIFLFLTAAVGVAGYRFYLAAKNAIQTEVENELSAVAAVKVNQVAAWMRERRGDARHVQVSSPLMPALLRVLQGRADALATAQIAGWLETLHYDLHYVNAILMDEGGRVRLRVGDHIGPPEYYTTLARQALETGDVIFDDLHLDKDSQFIHLGLSIPLRTAGREEAAGVLLLAIDPHQYLYPLIESWPTVSRTAETYLVRQEGDHVVFLNELRHRTGTALRLRLPLSTPRLPATRAVAGREGVVAGIDYRGASVLAAARKIPDSPWSLVAQMDLAEVNAPLRLQAFFVALVAAALIAATGAGVGWLLRRQHADFSQQTYRVELEHRALADNYEYLAKYANVAVLLADEEARIIEANERAAAVYGYRREELAGMEFRRLHDPTTLGDFENMWKASENGEGVLRETRHQRRDGSCFPVEVSVRAVAIEDKRFRQSIVRDISARKESERERASIGEQFRQAQKMESVGRLAGGVAHDFNNHLTVINGYSDLLLAKIAPQHPFHGPLDEIRHAGARAASLTQQLLAFSRKQVLEPKPLSLNMIVADAQIMLRRLVGEDIEIETELYPKLGTVLADAGQMNQVLMNLVVNAREAMPEGGRILIETRNVDANEAPAGRHADRKTGPYVELTISDTGAGMDQETQQRIFEPFFTTKHSGTGLGLSTVYGIVKQSDGWIWVHSRPEQGTTFKVYLPRLEQPVYHEAIATATIPLTGTETILVVEDQTEVRRLVVQVLKQYGYKVLAASGGKEALAICKGRASALHLMITDVVMPRMTGRDLANRLAQTQPGMKVLYISGYTADVIAHQGVLDKGVAYLPKPFTPEALARKVRQVLSNRDASATTAS